jgi:flavoprotein
MTLLCLFRGTFPLTIKGTKVTEEQFMEAKKQLCKVLEGCKCKCGEDLVTSDSDITWPFCVSCGDLAYQWKLDVTPFGIRYVCVDMEWIYKNPTKLNGTVAVTNWKK